MAHFHKGLKSVSGDKVIRTEDYSVELNGLPKPDVLFYTANSSVVIRPSGTEPKLKVYISVVADWKESAQRIEKSIAEDISSHLLP